MENYVDGQEINKMVENISEQDYYEKSGDKYTLKGMSIAIILDQKVERMQLYLKEV